MPGNRSNKISVNSARQTTDVAKLLAEEISATRLSKNAVVIGLSGDLGAGKTTFVKGMARGLGMRHKVISPTFILMRNFPIRGRYRKMYHIDAYRVEERALKQLGLDDIVNDPRNVVIIEWADRVRKSLPKGAIMIDIKHGKDKNERHITFNRR